MWDVPGTAFAVSVSNTTWLKNNCRPVAFRPTSKEPMIVLSGNSSKSINKRAKGGGDAKTSIGPVIENVEKTNLGDGNIVILRPVTDRVGGYGTG